MEKDKKGNALELILLIFIIIGVFILILIKDWSKIIDFNSNMILGVIIGLYFYLIFSYNYIGIIYLNNIKIDNFYYKYIFIFENLLIIIFLIIILFPIFQIFLLLSLFFHKELQLLFFSPNYLIVRLFKSKLKDYISKNEEINSLKEYNLRVPFDYQVKIKDNNISNVKTLKEYIISLNKWNLIISMILFIIVAVISFLEVSNTSKTSFLFYAIFYFIIYRTISRSVEIIISFGKDAITIENKSNFTIFERIELAIKSYFETLINFATSYYFIFDFDSKANIVDALIMSLGINTITNVPEKINGVAILSMNMLFVYLQVLTVLSLVILSIAMYASDMKESKEKKEKEEKDKVIYENINNLDFIKKNIIEEIEGAINKENKNIEDMIRKIENNIKDNIETKVDDSLKEIKREISHKRKDMYKRRLYKG